MGPNIPAKVSTSSSDEASTVQQGAVIEAISV
jgi:hypothetical protein